MRSPTDTFPSPDGRGRVRTTILALLGCLLSVCAAPTSAATFLVNSTADVPDADPSDGICRTASDNTVCTLRAAIMQANALPGADKIILPAGTYQLTIVGTYEQAAANGDLDIAESVTIIGAGPGGTIIDGNGVITGERVLDVLQCNPGGYVAGLCKNGQVVASISGVTIKNGRSPSLGGGVLNLGDLTLTNTAVIDNTASGDHGNLGGGIYNEATITVIDSTISGNMTIYYDNLSPGYGGGIFSSNYFIGGTLTIIGSTVSGNSAFRGGGVYNEVNNTIIINSTISNNSTFDSGGGIYVAGGSAALYNATVAENRANSGGLGSARGGGVAVANTVGTTLTFKNSIIALNGYLVATLPFPTFINDDCSGTITALGSSIISAVNMDHCTANGSPAIVDPIIGPLQYNGGLTQTYALLDGSPAIDGVVIGDCTDDLGGSLTTDQRGAARPVGLHCDIGAFEVQPDEIFKNGFQ